MLQNLESTLPLHAENSVHLTCWNGENQITSTLMRKVQSSLTRWSGVVNDDVHGISVMWQVGHQWDRNRMQAGPHAQPDSWYVKDPLAEPELIPQFQHGPSGVGEMRPVHQVEVDVTFIGRPHMPDPPLQTRGFGYPAKTMSLTLITWMKCSEMRFFKNFSQESIAIQHLCSVAKLTERSIWI